MVACLQSLHLTNALVILAATGAKLLVARCPPRTPLGATRFCTVPVWRAMASALPLPPKVASYGGARKPRGRDSSAVERRLLWRAHRPQYGRTVPILSILSIQGTQATRNTLPPSTCRWLRLAFPSLPPSASGRTQSDGLWFASSSS